MKNPFLLLLSVVAMCGSCTQNEALTDPSGAGSKIVIDPSVTRVTELSFEEADVIGVSIYKNGTDVYVDNSEYTYTNGLFLGEDIWYNDGAKSTIVAYYPYSEDGLPTTFRVASDQRGDNLSASDLLFAKAEDVTPSVDGIAMTFNHKLSKIRFNITNTSDYALSTVSLLNSITTAIYDEETVSYSADGAEKASTIVANDTEQNYSAIIVPQTAALEIAVEFEDAGISASPVKLAEATFAEGGVYTANINIDENAQISIKLSGEISNWTDGGELEAQKPYAPKADFIIKELYYAGASFGDGGQTFYSDQFISIYNHTEEVQYADNLYIGEAAGNNGSASGKAPIRDLFADAAGQNVYLRNVTKIPGAGNDYPVQPGESLVIALNARPATEVAVGGIVAGWLDLSDADLEMFPRAPWYENLYNQYWHTDNPAVPNCETQFFHYPETATSVIWKAEGASVMLFRPENDDFLSNTVANPLSTQGAQYIYMDASYIIDGIECLNLPTKDVVNYKRLPASVDAGYFGIRGGTSGGSSMSSKSVRRKFVDGKFVDTNNSSNDLEVMNKPTPFN